MMNKLKITRRKPCGSVTDIPNRRSVDMPSARTVLADPSNGLDILDEYERALWGELCPAPTDEVASRAQLDQAPQ